MKMTTQAESVHLFFTKEFKEIFETFISIVDDDPAFKEYIKERVTKDGTKDERIKGNKMNSTKIRFVITNYVNNAAIKVANAENHDTSIT